MVNVKDSQPEKVDAKSKRANGLSAHLTLINFLKGMIGPGCFSLPLAFKQAGLWTGFSLVFIIGFFCTVCMMKLVRCSQYLAKQNPLLATLDYGQMAEESFKNGSKRLRWFAHWARVLVNLCLMFLQLGICTIYFIFVCDHAMEIVESFNKEWLFSKTTYMIVAFFPFWAIVLVRNVKIMSYISLVGNIFMISSIVLIFMQLVVAKHQWRHLPCITDFDGIVLAAGAIIYSFEGQAMVLPLENRMKHGSEMRGLTGVLSTGMSLVTIVYVSSGFYGYITYGHGVRGSITLNLPDDNLNLSVKVLLMLVIFTGFPVQLYPVVESLWPSINNRLTGFNKIVRGGAHYTLRTGLFLMSVGLAVLLPNLEDLIPLVGVSAGMLLALIVPAILDTNTFLPPLLEEKKHLRAGLLLLENGVYAFTGVFFLVAGVRTNILHMMGKE